jgi:hypothetical protein
MEELEHIERERYGLFCLSGVAAFILLFVWRQDWLQAMAYAIPAGLFISGFYVARKTTSEYVWSLLLAEARVNGGTPSKGGIWLGNLFLPAVVLAASM